MSDPSKPKETKETKFVKITDVRGYTPEDSVRTLYPGSVYEVEAGAAKEITDSGRGSYATGKQTESAIRIGLPAIPEVTLGGSGGSSHSADPANGPAESAIQQTKEAASKKGAK